MPNDVTFNKTYPSITNSDLLYRRALNVIPSVTQTLAKGPGQYINGVAPKYLVRGKGAHVWDVDGNCYLDYNMAVGPLSLGYAYPVVDEAIQTQLKDGITFSLMHPLEVEVAEMVRDFVPNTQAVRFSKTGADVTSAAIRLARAFTGREKILCCGYHGWHDWYIAVSDRHAGIPAHTKELTYTFNYNDINSVLEALDDEIAAVILEPVVFQEPQDQFLHRLREVCDQNGTLLIFDEMWTGFRLALGGAQEYFKVHADLATFSKAIANGMPLSVLTGRRDIMSLLEKDVFFFTTFGGEALSLAAAKATMTEMYDKNVPSYLSAKGKLIKDGYNDLCRELGIDFTACTGLNCRSLVTFELSAGNPLHVKSLFQQEMIKRGILWSGFHNISFSHTERDIEYTLNVYREVLQLVSDAVTHNKVEDSLLGKPVEPVFRKTSNFNTKPKVKMIAHG